MARLPTPGGDDNQWGDILNNYLGQAHNTDGTAKDATGSSKGVIQLTGALGGTAASPTVPALTTHLETPLGDGVHSLITHNWQQDGWTPFTASTMTADGAQSYTTSVSGGKGTVTASASSLGNFRVAYLRDNTDWADSEMRSVFWGPASWNGNNAQQGHIHRIKNIGGNTYEGIAIWTSVVFGGDYGYLHVAGVRWDGTSTILLSGSSTDFGFADSTYIDRTMRVLGHLRFNFGIWINDYTVDQISKAQFLAGGDIVSISGMSDATFNETNIALSSVDLNTNTIRVTDPTDTTAVSYTPDGAGIVRPSSTSLQKRWTPFVMATRIIGGDANTVPVEIKRWRLGEAEPDWGDSRVRRGTATSNASVPSLALGPGKCGLWAAHFYSSNSGSWGDIMCRQL